MTVTTIVQAQLSISTDASVTLETIPAEDNYLVALVSVNYTPPVYPNISPASGWTLLSGNYAGAANGDCVPFVFVKKCGAGEDYIQTPTLQSATKYCVAIYEINYLPSATDTFYPLYGAYTGAAGAEYATTAAYDASPISGSTVSGGLVLWMVAADTSDAVSSALSDTPDGETATDTATDGTIGRAVSAGYYFTTTGQDLQVNVTWDANHTSNSVKLINISSSGDGTGSGGWNSTAEVPVTATVSVPAGLPSGFRYTTIKVT